MRRRMAENSISGAGKSSMPAARGQRAGQATRRGFSSQLHWSLPSFQHGVGRGEPTQAHSTERGAMAAPGARDGATWYAATTVAAQQRPPLVQDADVDVCVIGGGLAGLTIAREVVRRGWSAVVLEADKIAWSASGRNAGLVAPGFSERIELIIERVGLARAKELWALSAAGAEYVRATIRETGMPGISPVDGR